MPNSKIVSWETIPNDEVKLLFENGKILVVSYEDFRENTISILKSSFTEVYYEYLFNKKKILGVTMDYLEIGKRAYIYDAGRDDVIKTSTVKHFIVFNDTHTRVITNNSIYDVVTFGNEIIVPKDATERVQEDLKA